MAAGGPRTWPGFTPNPPKNTETIYDGSWGAANLARIHGLPTPQKNKTKKKMQRKKRDGRKTPKASHAA